MTNLLSDFSKAVKEGPQMYFAPLIGAIRAIQNEWRNQPTVVTRAKPRMHVRKIRSRTK